LAGRAGCAAVGFGGGVGVEAVVVTGADPEDEVDGADAEPDAAGVEAGGELDEAVEADGGGEAGGGELGGGEAGGGEAGGGADTDDDDGPNCTPVADIVRE
jgi:hypothetical protein